MTWRTYGAVPHTALHLSEQLEDSMHDATRLEDWATPETLVDQHPDKFTLPQLRWALRFRSENGLAEHVTRMGRRLYIHIPGFTRWFQEQGKEA